MQMSASRRPLMANHNRCWIWGRNVVLETLRAGRWRPLEVIYSDRCDPVSHGEVISLCSDLDVKATFVRDADIEKQCRSDEHQGMAARMPSFPYLSLDELLSGLPSKPALIMLDRVHDSYNFGAIVRSADVLGIDGVIIGTREQAQVNSLAARSSVGAINHVPIAQTEDLAETVQRLAERGFQIVGTSDRADDSIFDADFRQATLLMIGNEGRGMQHSLEALCTRVVQIPVLGRVNSLNAAVSAGILFYEVLRQRRQ